MVKGALDAYSQVDIDNQTVPATFIFRATPKTFIGVHSFFAKKNRSLLSFIATMDTKLAYIDHSTDAINCTELGDLAHQFMPIIIENLSTQQTLTIEASHSREVALKNLHINRQLSILGEMAADVTRELQNVMAVIERNNYALSKHYLAKLPYFYKQKFPRLSQEPYIQNIVSAFENGLNKGQRISQKDVRDTSQKIMAKYTISYDCAKRLSAMYEGALPKELPENYLDQLLEWEIGRNWHDLQRTSLHAARLLKSIQSLVNSPKNYILSNPENSLQEAISLMRNIIDESKTKLILNFNDVPDILLNSKELVQVWVNLIKNAIEAMQNAKQTSPRLKIKLFQLDKKIIVEIGNNGFEIPKNLHEKIFHPSFTTKNIGKSIGIGVGLSIVKRIINEHNAKLILKSDKNCTKFSIIFNR